MLFCVVFDFYRRILVGAVIFDILSAWGSFGRVLRRALSRPSDVGYTHARSGSFGSGLHPYFIVSRTRHSHLHKPRRPRFTLKQRAQAPHAAARTSFGSLNLRLRRTQSPARRRRRPLRLRFNETCRGAFGLISKYLFLNLGCGIGAFGPNFRLKFICFFILTM